MTELLDRPQLDPAPSARHRSRWVWLVPAFVVLVVVGAGAVERYRTADERRDYLGADGWPRDGEAAVQVGDRPATASPDQRPVPIASLAKVMTAYLVLATAGEHDVVVSAEDVRDTARRRHRDESVVAVAAGERLTERQALSALLLPSANNIAVMLARRVAGGVVEFVARMNAVAARLGMRHTRYTDPSGLDPGTVSTAADQLVLAAVVARVAEFASIVARRTARLPVAGTVRTTNAMLGRDGFAGTKTGSDEAAGGCFMFRARRVVGDRHVDVLGVVLGQHGRHLVTAGLYAGRQLADRVAPAG